VYVLDKSSSCVVFLSLVSFQVKKVELLLAALGTSCPENKQRFKCTELWLRGTSSSSISIALYAPFCDMADEEEEKEEGRRRMDGGRVHDAKFGLK
jgi:hypothetical protein